MWISPCPSIEGACADLSAKLEVVRKRSVAKHGYGANTAPAAELSLWLQLVDALTGVVEGKQASGCRCLFSSPCFRSTLADTAGSPPRAPGLKETRTPNNFTHVASSLPKSAKRSPPGSEVPKTTRWSPRGSTLPKSAKLEP